MVVNAGEGLLTALGTAAPGNSLFASPILELALYAGPGGSFASEALPLIPPELASLHPFEFDQATGYGTGILVAGIEGYIMAELLSLEAVPEPAHFALLAPLAFAVGVLRRRRSW